MALVVAVPAGWWLFLPAETASIAVAAQVHSLTLEVLCGEKLVWDLPPGEVRQRSVTVATRPKQPSGAVTLSLSAGARARLEASSVGALNLAVDRVESIARGCGKDKPSFEVTVGETRLPPDASGFFYAAAESKPEAGSVSLPLKGRIVLGRPVQHGGGWKQADSAAPESIFVTRRVVPAFSKERVTVGTDRLDDGSILDTHGCLDSTTDETRRCAARESELATGFLRASAGKGLEVQLYVRGPVGVRTYEGERQYLVSIPKISVAWQSELVVFWLALFVLLIGFWEILVKTLEYFLGREPSIDNSLERTGNAAESLSKNTRRENVDPTREKDDSTTARTIVPLVTLILLGLTYSTSSLAEPVEVRQEGSMGAGYSFRRGSACQVITAHHVVKEMGIPITVEDKTGARATGNRTYASAENDLALITLSDGAAVACTAPWPAVDWLRSASFSGSSAFRAVRHYTSGKEAIVRLTHAGGDRNHFSLAPVDKSNIRESDSGTIVEFEGKPVGIVLSVNTATDRVTVLRFDRIDELVGERFRGSAAASLVSFLGVLHGGRENPTWTQYMQAWMTEKAGRTVIAPARSGGEAAKAKCEVKVEVLAWEQARVANPERDTFQLPLKACGKKGFFYEQMCKQAKESLAAAPPYVASQRLTVNVTATPKGAPPQSKLVTSTLVPQSGKLSRADVELSALQATAGPPLSELFSRGVCD